MKHDIDTEIEIHVSMRLDESTAARAALLYHMRKLGKLIREIDTGDQPRLPDESTRIMQLLGIDAPLQWQIDHAETVRHSLGLEIARARDVIKIAKGERR